MSERLQIQKSGQVTLDASGNGTVQLGPTQYNIMWQTSVVGVRVSSNTLEPTCSIYLGPVDDSNFIGGTYSGSRDSDTSLTVNIPGGTYLSARWTGGDPGAVATLTILGTQVTG